MATPRTPKELEIVRFTHEGSQKDRVQPENVVIDGTPWESEGLADPEEALEALLEVVEEGPMLFGNRGRAVPSTWPPREWTARWP
jgi:hypothetical protein